LCAGVTAKTMTTRTDKKGTRNEKHHQHTHRYFVASGKDVTKRQNIMRNQPGSEVRYTPGHHTESTEQDPAQHIQKARFGDVEISFRLIRPGDGDLLNEFFHSHSEQTIIHRYFTPIKELTANQVHEFVNIDLQNDTAIIGLATDRGQERMVCVGRYFGDRQSNSAEVAITVHDDLQGRGLGTFLLRHLIDTARAHGIATLTFEVMADNHAMMALLRKCSRKLHVNLDSGVYHVEFPLRT
jgi:GNAT superfamily N-acetyltransferase